MCMCKTPNINGNHGYSWDGKREHVRQPDPPELQDGDELLCDEPGRCGGLDSHCHHVRLVKRRGRPFLLVCNGTGDHELMLPRSFELSGVLETLNSNSRYWLLLSFYNTASNHGRSVKSEVNHRWRTAAAEKRIKTRKQRGRDAVKVWIEPRA